jgi:hypothetical protein
MANAWDYGPGDRSSVSLSLEEMLSGGSQALTAIVNASNDIKKALGSSSVSASETKPESKSMPVWVWVIGAVIVYKVAKG